MGLKKREIGGEATVIVSWKEQRLKDEKFKIGCASGAEME